VCTFSLCHTITITQDFWRYWCIYITHVMKCPASDEDLAISQAARELYLLLLDRLFGHASHTPNHLSIERSEESVRVFGPAALLNGLGVDAKMADAVMCHNSKSKGNGEE
jgi:hypothetical protein